MKKLISMLLCLTMILSVCVAFAEATPVAPPTKEADTYTGIIRDYDDKPLWFDTTVYHGFYSAYQILQGNGDDTFDADAFINSYHGELMISRIKYELALIGDANAGCDYMVQYWAGRGVSEKVYNAEDADNIWIAYAPDYIKNAENAGTLYPVVFSFHGGGGTIFEATNHGYVDICCDKGLIVIYPQNMTNLAGYLDQLEADGYPIDRTRVYASGMSIGGMVSMSISIEDKDIIATAAAHSSARELAGADAEKLAACEGMPLYLHVGQCDYKQLPLDEENVAGLNNWLAMNGCNATAATTDNMIGITADKIVNKKIDGTGYTFAEFYDQNGVRKTVIVGIENLPHWVSYSFAELSWNFLSQFSKVDGKLVVNQ